MSDWLDEIEKNDRLRASLDELLAAAKWALGDGIHERDVLEQVAIREALKSAIAKAETTLT